MIKVWPADKAFADCTKIACGYRCQACGTVYGEKHRGLHLSHFVGRGNWSVRFHPDNGWSHCFACHRRLGANPPEFSVWVREQIGQTRYEWLLEAARDIDMGRQARREKKDIAKHYREQISAMQGRRDKGELGDFMVVSYA